MASSDCIFCQILAGDAEVSWIARENGVAAFMDLHPVNPGHALVVPETHSVGLADLDPNDGREVMALGQRVAAAIRASGLPSDGINLIRSFEHPDDPDGYPGAGASAPAGGIDLVTDPQTGALLGFDIIGV